ncbi:acyltransferase family protein [Leifsonia sp. NPDC058194]|uniref:acyltransferase family protein n=1 Tax=Leifsonia sp. NPDC058194 TaxID=3346374 RepID=UPI0036D7F752
MTEAIEARAVVAEGAHRSRIDGLDYLRLIAALAVVAFHWIYYGPWVGIIPLRTSFVLGASYGVLGVELFFIISGFVIATSIHGRDAGGFLASRATRLYPAYWAGLIVSVGVLALTNGLGIHGVKQILANVTMFAPLLGYENLEGVYWTLQMELLFYIMVAVFVLAGKRSWLDLFFPIWAIGMLVSTILLPLVSELPLLGYLNLFFAGGAVIAGGARSGWTPLRIAGLAAAVIGGAIAAVRHGLKGPLVPWEPAIVVAVVVGMFGVVLLLTVPRIARARLPGSRVAGAITYPLYLVHCAIGYALIAAVATPETAWWVTGACLVVVLGVSYLIHRLVEQLPAGIWRTVFGVCIARPVRRLQTVLTGGADR